MQSTNKSQISTNKIFDLQERLLEFSKQIILETKKIPLSFHNKNILSQLLRSSTSVGANYTEANDALGKKDFLHRLRIARKEAKETIYWLKLLQTIEPHHESLTNLIQECSELKNILSAIINKSSKIDICL